MENVVVNVVLNCIGSTVATYFKNFLKTFERNEQVCYIKLAKPGSKRKKLKPSQTMISSEENFKVNYNYDITTSM